MITFYAFFPVLIKYTVICSCYYKELKLHLHTIHTCTYIYECTNYVNSYAKTSNEKSSPSFSKETNHPTQRGGF